MARQRRIERSFAAGSRQSARPAHEAWGEEVSGDTIVERIQRTLLKRPWERRALILTGVTLDQLVHL